jgi:hypothetical protein
MDKELTVACVLWEGDFRTRNYSFEWVRKLKHMVAENLTIPHEFVCLSNLPLPQVAHKLGIKRIPLVNDWPGWWSKIELFRPGLFKNRVLYLDLDLIIIRNIDLLASEISPFILLRSEYKGKKKTGDGLSIYKYNSSVMGFYPNTGITQTIYNNFDNHSMKIFRGDQDYYAHVNPHLDTFAPGQVVKLKDCPGGRLHNTAKIVLCMPDKNDKAAHIYKWVGEVWNHA